MKSNAIENAISFLNANVPLWMKKGEAKVFKANNDWSLEDAIIRLNKVQENGIENATPSDLIQSIEWMIVTAQYSMIREEIEETAIEEIVKGLYNFDEIKKMVESAGMAPLTATTLYNTLIGFVVAFLKEGKEIPVEVAAKLEKTMAA